MKQEITGRKRNIFFLEPKQPVEIFSSKIIPFLNILLSELDNEISGSGVIPIGLSNDDKNSFAVNLETVDSFNFPSTTIDTIIQEFNRRLPSVKLSYFNMSSPDKE